jgi:anti-sigma B factor antagonist
MITDSRTYTIEPHIKVLALSGRLSLGNALMSLESSVRRLIEDGARKLVIDLSGLKQIDSAGIGMLVTCNGLMEKQGGHMRIAGSSGLVTESFELVHMHRIVPMDESIDVAARNLSGDAATA